MSQGRRDGMAVGDPPARVARAAAAYSPSRSSVSALGTPSASQPRSS